MAPSEPREFELEDHVFPHEAIWEEFPGHLPTFDELAANSERYELLNGDLLQPLGVARYDAPALASLVQALSLAQPTHDELLQKLKLVAGFYLSSARNEALGVGRDDTAKLLAKIAARASELSQLLDKLGPAAAAMLFYTPSGDELWDGQEASHPNSLAGLMRRLARVASYHSLGIARRRGSPSEFVRDATVQLAMQAALDAGLGRPSISERKGMHGKRVSKPAGELLRAFLHLIGSEVDEKKLVQLVERIRPRLGAHSLK